MASDLREFLAKHGLRDEVIEEAIEIGAPDFYRSEIAKVGAKAKRADELEAELGSIRAEPKRLEAYKRVGLIPQDATDASGLKPYQKDWLNNNIPVDKLEDLEYVAGKVSEGGFEVQRQPEQQGAGEKTGAQQITDFTANAGTTPGGAETYEEAVAKAESPEALDAVYQRFGKPAAVTG